MREKKIGEEIQCLVERYPALAELKEEIAKAYSVMADSFENGGKLLVCGNGGSASDAEHIVGELMKGFQKRRPLPDDEKKLLGEMGERLQGTLPAIALTGHSALSTAFSNDVDPFLVFAQQVYGYGRKGDVLLALTTSGNSKNVIYAAQVAHFKGMKVIGLTGKGGGELKRCCDVCLSVPGERTAQIQEYHLPIYHALCVMLEEHFFEE